MTKPTNYTELLKARCDREARPTRRVKICLQPDLIEAAYEARERHANLAAEAREKAALGKSTPRKLAEIPEVKKAEEALDAAMAALDDACIVLVLRGLTTDEMADAHDEAGDHASTTERSRYAVLAGFSHAETSDGTTLGDITRDDVAELLPNLTQAEYDVVAQALIDASRAAVIDFPTLRR